jgi:hypothetical protein
MMQYRVYYLSSQALFVAPPVIISAVDDDDAVHQAKALRDGFDIEIWESKRLVRRLDLGQPSNSLPLAEDRDGPHRGP